MSSDRRDAIDRRPARPRWVLLAAAAALLVVVAVVLVVVLGGDDSDGGDASGDDGTTTESAPPSEVELEAVTLDLDDAASPATELEAGDLTVAFVPGTLRGDGDLVALEDDRGGLAPEPITPLIRLDVALPELDPLLADVGSVLTTDALAGLVGFAGAEGAVPEDVVSSWLASNDLAAPTPIVEPGPMRIQTRDVPDLRIAALVYGEVLLAAGFDIEYLPPAATTDELIGSVRDRRADLVLDGGSTLLVGLGGPTATAADELRAAITAAAAEVAGTAQAPASADRALRARVSAATAEDLGLATLTDLGRVEGRHAAGVVPGCDVDPLCQPLLETAYGLRFAP